MDIPHSHSQTEKWDIPHSHLKPLSGPLSGSYSLGPIRYSMDHTKMEYFSAQLTTRDKGIYLFL